MQTVVAHLVYLQRVQRPKTKNNNPILSRSAQILNQSMCKRKTKSNRLHTNDTYFKKAKNTLSETYPFKKKREPIKESLLAGWLAGLLAGSPACIIVSGNYAHLLHCFPAVFLLLCFGSCLIVLGGCLGDTRSEFSLHTEMDGRGGQKMKLQNV